MVRSRWSLAGLRVALDLPATVVIAGAEVHGGFIDFDLDGAVIDAPPEGTSARAAFDAEPAPDEVVAEYEVDGTGRRRFLRFKRPEGPTETPLGALDPDVAAGINDLYPPHTAPPAEQTLPPSGAGSRGGRTTKE